MCDVICGGAWFENESSAVLRFDLSPHIPAFLIRHQQLKLLDMVGGGANFKYNGLTNSNISYFHFLNMVVL